MTRIDFYQVASDETPLLFTCRLIDKIYHRGHQIHIHAADDKQAEELDELLWHFRPDRFIPHEITSNTESSKAGVKVKISHIDEPDHQDILVNLSGRVPHFFSRFDRVAEVVPLDENSRDSARENYGFYRDRGYQLHYHEMTRTK